MKHYDVLVTFKKGTLNVIIEKKYLADFIVRNCKGAKEIVIKEVDFNEEVEELYS